MLNKTVVQKNCKGAQKVKFLCLSSIILGVVLWAFPVKAQSNDVSNRLNRLENEIETLNRAVYKGEKAELPIYSTGRAATGAAAQTEIRLQQMETQIRELTGRIEEQNYEIRQLNEKLKSRSEVQKSIESTQTQSVVSEKPVKTVLPALDFKPPVASAMRTAVPGGGSTDATAQYELAYSNIKSKNYEEAQKGFEAFLGAHNDHVLAANAKYWLGETHYVRGDYKKAARIFAEGYRTYPDSAKSPDILLKLGMSLVGMDKEKEACVALAQLPLKFPSGTEPVVRRAEQEMKKLNCDR